MEIVDLSLVCMFGSVRLLEVDKGIQLIGRLTQGCTASTIYFHRILIKVFQVFSAGFRLGDVETPDSSLRGVCVDKMAILAPGMHHCWQQCNLCKGPHFVKNISTKTQQGMYSHLPIIIPGK